MPIEWCACPDCGALAEIRFRVQLIDEITQDVVDNYVTMCAAGHFLTTPSWLVPTDDDRT